MRLCSPVVAAIPTYNMEQEVCQLVPHLLEHEFDHVVILDDNSHDHTSERLLDNFGDQIVLEQGKENLGSAGNRNRILKVITRLGLSDETVINFVDADTEIIPTTSQSIPSAALRLMNQYPNAGTIGNAVYNRDLTWSAFNYGPLFSLGYLRSSLIQMKVDQLQSSDLRKADELYKQKAGLLEGWPNPTATQEATKAGWVVECSTLIRAGVLRAIKGYDQSLRYCEALDMGAKLNRLSLDRQFDPTLAIRHLQVDNRGIYRYLDIAAAIMRIAARHLSGQYR